MLACLPAVHTPACRTHMRPYPALPPIPCCSLCRSKLQQQGWKFVVTGHSLGAAVATLLGMQLRDRFTGGYCQAGRFDFLFQMHAA